jgi:V/A-type H+-transporting ATPase subunit D
MDPNTFPTKGNLIRSKNSLILSKQGYDLMDKKRNILIREMMQMTGQAESIQSKIDVTFRTAYAALQEANIDMGITNIEKLAGSIPVDNSVQIKVRSIMGVEIPVVESKDATTAPTYAFYRTQESLDKARLAFTKVRDLTIELSAIESATYRLASNIKRTQKRANALQNITVPYYKTLVKDITNALEEKEREEFTRLKVIKKRKQNK